MKPNLLKFARHFGIWAGSMALFFALLLGITIFCTAHPIAFIITVLLISLAGLALLTSTE